jgi:soluble lytic murein transglycosylase
LASKGDWAEASSLSSAIKDPTARILIDWYLFRSDFPRQDFMSLANFVDKHKDWPGVIEIRVKAERIFPKNYPDSYVLNWFKNYEPISYEGAMRYAEALYRGQHINNLQKMWERWLPESQITPQEQNEIIRKYGSIITKETWENRLHSALLSDQYTNARATARLLGKDYVALAEARIALSAKGKGVDRLISQVPASLSNDTGLILERVKWRRRSGNIKGAVALMLAHSKKETHSGTLKALWKERHILIRELIEQKKHHEAYNLAALHQQKEGFAHAQAQWMTGWLALRYQKKPMEAFHRFNKLYQNVETPISKSRGAYWAARASEALGDTQTAQAWYKAAAIYPTVFYGQMALDKIGQQPNYSGKMDKGVSLDQAADWPKVRAARLLYKAGLNNDAEKFIYSLIKDAQKGTIQYGAIAQLAKDLGMINLSIHTAKKAETDGVYLMQYAFPHLIQVTRQVNAQDHALLHGLIRQESAFNLQAKSRSGALGLMQLMPATARETAGKVGVSYSKKRLTTDASYNIKLGATYISRMLDRFDDSYPLAIAAYNGGPGRVSGWIKTYGSPKNLSHDDRIDWIESIPVYETRNYVQRVTEAMRVYSDIFQASGFEKSTVVAWNNINK